MERGRRQINRLALVAFQSALLACPAAALAQSPWLVGYVDGPRTSAPAASMPWMAAGVKFPASGPLKLDGKPLRWARDPEQPQFATSGPAVEFFGGDVLPAKILAYEKDSEESGGQSYLLVEPAVPADAAADKQQSVRVSTAWIKRVVWEPRRGGRYQPGSLIYRDGRQSGFRAARWTEGGVRLLVEDGTVLVTFDQIAELHFPLPDIWAAYVGQLAVLSPDAAAWLVHVETASGLKATTSTTRSRVLAASSPGATGPDLLVQPAWALDPLVVSCARIGGWMFFAPDEVPLSTIEPRRAVQRAILGVGWPAYLVDSNVQGGPLRNSGEQFGWGLGVHAFSQLDFDLPPIAQSFSSYLGLDETAASGGCVQATVSLTGAHAAKNLFTSSTLIGSAETLATGPLKLEGLGSGARLRLVVDPLAADRPPRADPLDIRDAFDWLEPIVRLDAPALRRALLDHWKDPLWRLADWTMAGEPGKDWRVVNELRSATRPQRGFRPMLEATTSPILLRRKLRLEAGRDQFEWLCRPLLADGSACTVEVVADGRPMDKLRITGEEPMSGPHRVSLSSLAGREIEITVKLSTPSAPLVIDWERLELVAAAEAKPTKP